MDKELDHLIAENYHPDWYEKEILEKEQPILIYLEDRFIHDFEKSSHSSRANKPIGTYSRY